MRSSAYGEPAAEDPELRASVELAHAEQRRLRPELPGGIGGQTRTGSLKCLHAHAAFALARPGYTLGERILAEVEPLWPSRECCTPASIGAWCWRRSRRPDASGQRAIAASRRRR